MSAEVPTGPQEPQRPQLAMTNRGQVVLFAVLTLLLTALTVWGARTWLRDSETLIFAVGVTPTRGSLPLSSPDRTRCYVRRS